MNFEMPAFAMMPHKFAEMPHKLSLKLDCRYIFISNIKSKIKTISFYLNVNKTNTKKKKNLKKKTKTKLN